MSKRSPFRISRCRPRITLPAPPLTAEAAANVAIGFVVALLTQMALFPAPGLRLSMDRHLLIGTVFTLVSLTRSYLLRRLFER